MCDTSPIDGGYICTCPPGYKGVDCTQDIDECQEGLPCEHNGTCVNTPGSFRFVERGVLVLREYFYVFKSNENLNPFALVKC